MAVYVVHHFSGPPQPVADKPFGNCRRMRLRHPLRQDHLVAFQIAPEQEQEQLHPLSPWSACRHRGIFSSAVPLLVMAPGSLIPRVQLKGQKQLHSRNVCQWLITLHHCWSPSCPPSMQLSQIVCTIPFDKRARYLPLSWQGWFHNHCLRHHMHRNRSR